MSNILLDAAVEQSTRIPATLNVNAGLEDAIHEREETLLLNQIQVENEDIDNLLDIAAGLEAIYQNATTGVPVNIIKASIKTQYVRIGLEDIVDNIHDYDVGMESIVRTVKRVWNAIKDAIRRAIAAVKDWWRKLIDRTEATMERAKDLVEAHTKLQGNAKKEKVNLPLGVGGKLYIDGQLDIGRAMSALRGISGIADAKTAFGNLHLIESITKLAELDPVVLVKEIADDDGEVRIYNKMDKAINGTIEAMYDSVTLKKSKIGKIGSEVVKMFYTDRVLTKAYEAFPVADSIFITEELPGGKVLGILGSKTVSKELDDATLGREVLTGAKLIPAGLIKGKFVWKKEAVKTLDLNEIGEIAKYVVEMVQRVMDYNKFFNNKALGHINKMMKAVDSFTADITPRAVNDLKEDLGIDEKQARRNLQRAHFDLTYHANRARKMTEQPALSVISYLMSTANAMLSYAERSASQYDGVEMSDSTALVPA